MTKSNSEELIGILWFILAIMLNNTGVKGWWIVALVLGIICMIASIMYAILGKMQRHLDKLRKEAKNK